MFALWREAPPFFLIFQFKLFHPLLWLLLIRQQNKTYFYLSCKRLSVLITILSQEYIHLVQFSTFLKFIIVTQRVTRTHDYHWNWKTLMKMHIIFIEILIMYFQNSNPQLLFLGDFFAKTPSAKRFHIYHRGLCHIQAEHFIASKKDIFLFVHKAGFVPWWKMHC